MKRFNILYVDDEASNLRIFKDTFRRKFNIYTALSAKEGIEILDSHKIDLVLSDQRMPKMTGVELLQYSLQKYPESNRILITGYSDFQAIEDAINCARIFQYVQKPWEEGQLLKVIEDALKIYRLEQENKEQQAELIKAKERAEESDKLKSAFINNMSHEIRTPMNGILGFSELITEPDLSEDQRMQYIDIIKASSRKLLQIIEDILEISQLGTQQVNVYRETIMLKEFLEEIIAENKHKADIKGIVIVLNLQLEDIKQSVISDKAKLKKILNNILDNAVKFTEDGHIELSCSVGENRQVKFCIRDTGFGIEESYHRIIFSPFAQGDKELAVEKGGLGLGLAIANENTKLIGGTLSLNSEKGKGATFCLQLPSEIKTYEAETESVHQIKKATGAYTILVAEDEDINFLYLKTLIKTYKTARLDVLRASNGDEAVNIVNDRQGKIDLILMDIKMPVKDGLEATHEIKQQYPDIPVIAQTAYTSAEDLDKAGQAGCRDVLSKPMSRASFESMIQKYLM